MDVQNGKGELKIPVKQIGAVLIIAVIIVALCIAFAFAKSSGESGNDLVIQGNLKTTETDLNSKLAGTVKETLVKEGDQVKEGQTLIVMDSDTLAAKKQQAQAALSEAQSQQRAASAVEQAAQTQYQKALNGARSQEVAQAKVQLDLAESTYNRIKPLYEQGAVPATQYDQAKAQYDAAKQTYDMAAAGTRTEDKEAAKAQVAQAASAVETAKGAIVQAQGAVNEVDSYLEDSVIKAPMDGTVTTLNVNPGQLVSTGMPLATVSSSQKPWVELDVPETHLGMVKLNQNVKVSFLAYPGKEYEGTVVRVSEKPDFATKRATNNNGDFDVLSYGVKVEISGADQELYPGMTVLVDFGKKAGK